MKKVNYHHSTSKVLSFCLVILLAFSTSIFAQKDAAKGKALFNANCAACHKLDKRTIGPALAGVSDRRKRDWLHSWIKDSQALIASGDADAKAIFEEYKIPMASFSQFSDDDLDNILEYLTPSKEAATATKEVAQGGGDAVNGKKIFNANCAACHKLDKRTVGPALGNVGEKRKKEWLHSWIKDSQALIASGDADAKAIFDEYKIPMASFSQFSDAELDDIIAYTTPSLAKAQATPAAPAASAAAPSTEMSAQAKKGKGLFNTNCAACHKLDKKATGPALRGVTERREKEWLYKWIKNSKSLIDSGDADAKAIFDEFKIPMTPFPQLSDEDIDAILAYTSMPKAEKAVVAVAAGEKEGEGSNTTMILGLFALVLAVLLAVLFFVNRKLKSIAADKGIVVEEGVSLWKAFIQNQFLVLVAVILFALFGAFHVFGFFMQVGVDEGYKPVQPIHFSHKIHAGDNGIDCKYCHSNARVSKTSGIPALNVCMNCHKSISEVAETTATAEYSKEFYDGEIQKLYDAVGWKDFKYTGETKPVQWVRVHNLPDFAYYNHSQHVSVAGLKCQECHGAVEEMEILEQHAQLTMGWCIDCHRTKEVNMEGNAYYEKIHDQLKKKYGVDKFTVAQMGGMECGKCHY